MSDSGSSSSKMSSSRAKGLLLYETKGELSDHLP